MRDEIIAELLAMPGDVEVVVGIGHYRVDVTRAVYDAERDQIVLCLPADDMQFALERLGPKAAGRTNQRKRV